MYMYICVRKEEGGMREAKYRSSKEEKENKGNK